METEKKKVTRANARTFEEWMALYKQKTGDYVSVPPGFTLNFLEDRGICVMKPEADTGIFVIYDLCGDAKFWRDLAELYCRQNGLKCISTICTRRIRPYIRFWGWKIIKEQHINGQERYICKDKLDRYVVITFKGINEISHRPDYWVTEYMGHEAPSLSRESE